MLRKGCLATLVVFGFTLGGAQAQDLEYGVLYDVGDAWQTVTLSHTYTDMVVICTPSFGAAVPSVVTRVRNASGNSFQVRVQHPSLTPSTLSGGYLVYYMVVESGVYTQAVHGFTMEAFHYVSTKTAYDDGGADVGWQDALVDAVTGVNTYTNPVVLGQVMTFNDPNWSVFFSRGATQVDPVVAGTIFVGKHVGEEGQVLAPIAPTRADEVIGCIVIEASSGTMSGVQYTADTGPDQPEGINETPAPWTYTVSGLSSARVAVCSQTAQQGDDGSWAVLYGDSPVRFDGSAIDVALAEDQMLDEEQEHSANPVCYIVFGSPVPITATVTRSLPDLIAYSGTPFPVQLDATPLAAGPVTVTEMVPAGLTATNLAPTAGNASFSLGIVTWTVTLGSTQTETLTYDVTPSAGPTEFAWGGTYDAGATALLILGDSTAMAANPLGIFDWHGDIGFEPLGQPNGNPSVAGSASFTDPRYTVTGAGENVNDNGDRCHLLAKTVPGSFVLEGTVSLLDPATTKPDTGKYGLMIRSDIASDNVMMDTLIRDHLAAGGLPGDVQVQGRTREKGGSWFSVGWQASGAPTAPAVQLRIARAGTLVVGAYFDGANWVTHTAQVLDDLTAGSALACLFVTSTFDDSTGTSPPATAFFDDVSVSPFSLRAAPRRTILAAEFTIGQPVPVAIDLVHGNDANPLVVRETLPAGWTAVNISDGGTQTGDVITWNLNFTGDIQLTYDAYAKGGVQQAGLFDGVVEDPSGLVIPIVGDTQITRQGSSPIIFITETSNARYGDPYSGTEEGNYQAAIGPVGLNIDGTPIPGLGYPIRIIDDDDPAEDADFGPADGILVIVTGVTGNGAISGHNDDPLPFVNTQGNDLDDGDATEMYFSAGSANRDTAAEDLSTIWNITNNMHPITSFLPLGNVQVAHPGGNPETRMRAMTGNKAAETSGILFLAWNAHPTYPNDAFLAVAEEGATGFRPGGLEPAVARRVGLGMHRCLTTPTVEGIYLVQRCVQWAIGAPVTAGTGPPSAPDSLTTSSIASDAVLLQWNDTSFNENGFVIQRKAGATGTYVDIAQVGAGIASFGDANLSPGTTYVYRVRAFNVAGDSANSNEARFHVFLSLDARRWYLYR